MAQSVVIVESPSKAKTINKYLGSDYKVIASYGHVRDLPSKNGSVNPNDNFSMIWELDEQGKKHIGTQGVENISIKNYQVKTTKKFNWKFWLSFAIAAIIIWELVNIYSK